MLKDQPMLHDRQRSLSSGSPTFVAISLLPEGRNPGLPAFTPDHRFLFVPNQDTDNVSVVSLEKLTVVQTIKLRDKGCPWQAKVTPDGRLAFVTNSMFSGTVAESSPQNSTVSVIDVNKGEVVAEIPVGAGPNGVTVDRAGQRAYVVNSRSNTVSVIDIAAQQVIATVPVGRAPAFAKLTRDGRLLVVTNFEDATLSLIDPAQLGVVHTIQVGQAGLTDPYPEWGPGDTVGVAITPDDIAYVTNWRSSQVVVVDLNKATIVTSLSPIERPFGVEIDTELGLVFITSGTVKGFAVIDLSTNEVIAHFPTDGTVFPTGRIAELNHWMTDPVNHRITALLPNGIAGIAKRWDRNVVNKPM